MYQPPDNQQAPEEQQLPAPPSYSHAPYNPQEPLPFNPYPPAVVQQRDLRDVVDESADRSLSALAHGAIAFGILGIGLLISLAISGFLWIYGKRSRKVRFHAEQAGCYQVIVLTVNALAIVGLGFAGGFAIFQNFAGRSDFGTPWLLCIGLALFVPWFAGTILYGVYGAFQVLRGREFRYRFIGDWIKKRVG